MIYISISVLYNKDMKKPLKDKNELKKCREDKVLKNDNTIQDFSMGDECIDTNSTFTEKDLESIILLDDSTTINTNLFDADISSADHNNIYSLMDEGVLKGHLTGADLGIYNYQKVDDIKQEQVSHYSDYLDKNQRSIYNFDVEDDDKFEDIEDFSFSNCVLAEESPLDGKNTQVIITFRGYLEIGLDGHNYIKKCNCDNSSFTSVEISRYFIDKYWLRNGDEIVCTCKEIDGKMNMTSLLSINEISYYKWDINRKWYNSMPHSLKIKKLKSGGDYTEDIVKKFDLLKGDNVFLYFNKNSQKSYVLPKLIAELSSIFDKVIYINPQYRQSLIEDEYNIVKFCANQTDTYNAQITATLLGANYAKRMIELGKNIAIVVDDIDAVAALDKQFSPEMPVSKCVLSCSKSTSLGSGTSFVAIPLRSDIVNTFTPHTLFKAVETIGVVIDNNEIDMFNSYRI